MAETPILYTFRRCPYAMRARMALVASGTSVRVREIILRDKPDEMLELSPKGSVPVLQLATGQVIDESLDVMMWAMSQNDPANLWPKDEDMRRVSLELIGRNDGPFKHHLDRYKYATRYEDADAEAHRDAGAAVLSDLNDRLERDGQLTGREVKLVDLAIFPFVRQFRIADPEWFDAQPWTALKAWLSAHMESELFTSVMAKYPLWKDTGDEGWLPNAA